MTYWDYVKPPKVRRVLSFSLFNSLAKKMIPGISNIEVVPIDVYVDIIKDVVVKEDLKIIKNRGALVSYSKKFNTFYIILNTKVLSGGELVCNFFHELGHIKFGHIQKRKKGLPIKEIKKTEIEANNWAFNFLKKSCNFFSINQLPQLRRYFDIRNRVTQLSSIRELEVTGIDNALNVKRAVDEIVFGKKK